MNRRTKLRVASLGMAMTLTIAACSDDKSDTAATSTGASAPPASSESSSTVSTPTSAASATGSTGPAQRGGSLTYGVWIEASGLDPLVVGGPNIGGVEAMAVFDTVMRWNPETREYEGRTAQSLEPNVDASEWTLKLRPNIKFTDGTPYDAEAVKFSIERHQSDANTTSTRDGVLNVKSMEVVDDLTLKFTLTETWPKFPVILAGRPGMVPSPTAVKKCGTAKPRECEFNTAPVGAGPFKVVSFKPTEGIEMTPNPDYYGGAPYIENLKFVALPGPQATLEGLQAGDLNMALLRSAPVIVDAKAAGYTGHSSIAYGGALTLMNLRQPVECAGGEPKPICADKPDGPVRPTPATVNPKVRQAIAASLDSQQLNDRVWGGKALAGTEIFQKGSEFFTGSTGFTHDVDKAKRLVAEAKAEGWDGVVRYNCYDDPTNRDRSLAISSMLEAAGIEVQTKNMAGGDLISQVIVNKDFDLSCWGFPLHQDDSTYLVP